MTDHPMQRHYLNLYKLGEGPYYCFYRPYHLCHFEVPASVARAVLFNDATLAPAGGPQVGVVAVAKKDLAPGEMIEEFGGYHVYGVADNVDQIRHDRALPVGLSLGCRVARPVAKDTPLTFDDVIFPEQRIAESLYDEQERHFTSERDTAAAVAIR
jgi:predicted homoserine dehydrogenase-like protein